MYNKIINALVLFHFVNFYNDESITTIVFQVFCIRFNQTLMLNKCGFFACFFFFFCGTIYSIRL